jgi:Tfp pilus assembly PilM family ATPase
MSPAAPRWLAAASPDVGVELAARRVTVVQLAGSAGNRVVAAHATEPLPDEAVTPTINATNIVNPAVCAEALGRAFDKLGSRPKRVALIVPDGAAKVSIVRFDKVPPREEDLAQLVRWQVRKTAPFRLEDAQVAYVPGAPQPDGGREFIVTLMRRDVVEEYERVCSAAGAHAGVVDIASFNLINLVLASDAESARGLQGSPRAQASGVQGAPRANEDLLLVNVARESGTIAILRGGDLIFFRNRSSEADGSLADLVHQSAMYYEDRLGGAGFTRTVLAGAASALRGDEAEALRRDLEERLGARLESIDPRPVAALRDRIAASPELLDTIAAPVGLLLREAA